MDLSGNYTWNKCYLAGQLDSNISLTQRGEGITVINLAVTTVSDANCLA